MSSLEVTTVDVLDSITVNNSVNAASVSATTVDVLDSITVNNSVNAASVSATTVDVLDSITVNNSVNAASVSATTVDVLDSITVNNSVNAASVSATTLSGNGASITSVIPADGSVSTGKIESAAVTSDKIESDVVNALVPSGAIQCFAMSTAPTGWLKANGAAVSRTTYASLFSAIGTTFGSGDGSTTFNLPDLRGEFVRGWSDGRSVDTGRSFGTSQGDQLQYHTHGIGYVQASFGTGTANRERVTNNNERQSKNSGTTGDFGSETRPRNVALLYCIKY